MIGFLLADVHDLQLFVRREVTGERPQVIGTFREQSRRTAARRPTILTVVGSRSQAGNRVEVVEL